MKKLYDFDSSLYHFNSLPHTIFFGECTHVYVTANSPITDTRDLMLNGISVGLYSVYARFGPNINEIQILRHFSSIVSFFMLRTAFSKY